MQISTKKLEARSLNIVQMEGSCCVKHIQYLILYGPCIILQYVCNTTRYTIFED